VEATGEIWARSRLRAAAGDVWVRIHHDFPCEAVTVLSLIERSRHSGTIATMPRRHCNMSYVLACFVGYTGYTPVPAGPKCETPKRRYKRRIFLACGWRVGLCRAACPTERQCPGARECRDRGWPPRDGARAFKIQRGGPTDFVSTHADHTRGYVRGPRRSPGTSTTSICGDARHAARLGSGRLTVVILKDSTRSRSQSLGA
jgi:hypothetical protein